MARAVYMCNDKGLTLPGCNECDDLQSQIDHLKTEVAGKVSSDELIAGDHIQIVVDENGVTISSGITRGEILSLLGYQAIELSKTDSDGIRTTIEVLGNVTTETLDPPIINGANDVTIEKDSTFDDEAGVSAYDYNGASIPFTVTGTVDTSTVGDYTLTYTATDDFGRTTTVTRVVTVEEV